MRAFRWFALSLLLAVVAIDARGDADVSVEKVASPAVVQAGSEITYSITARNNGPDVAPQIRITDPLPENTTFVTYNDNHGSTAFNCFDPRATNNEFLCTGSGLGPGGFWTVTLVVRVNPSASGLTITNTANASSTASDPNPANNSVTIQTPVTAMPPTDADISVTKTVVDSAVGRGEVATFEIGVRNGGPIAAQNVALTDTIPTGTTFESLAQTSGPAFNCTTPAQGATGAVSCSIASFADQALAVFSLAVRVDATTDGQVSNTATVSSPTPDPDTDDRTATASFRATRPGPDVQITKTASPAEVTAGESIYYTISLTNVGSQFATGVHVVDPVPANTTFRYAIYKGGTGGGCAPPEVTQSGAVECTSNSGLGSFEIAVRVDSDAAGATITNTATVHTTSTDPDLSNNSDTVTTPVSGTPPATADLVVDKRIPDHGHSYAGPGEVVTYEIGVHNNGLAPAQNATLTDTLPAGTTFESLTQTAGPTFNCSTPAQGATGTVSCSIASLDNAGLARFSLSLRNANASGSISNTASVSSTTPDPDSANNSSTETVTVTEVAGADLMLSKTADPSAAEPGDFITYTLTATNMGSRGAGTVYIDDPVPANTTFVSVGEPPGTFADCFDPAVNNNIVRCRISGIGPQESFGITFVVRVNEGATGTIANTATVETSTTEADLTNNSASAQTTLPGDEPNPRADLELTGTATPERVTPGSTVTYRLAISNIGDEPAGDIVTTDALPAHTTFVSVSDDGGIGTTCFPPSSAGNVQCFTSALSPGETHAITLVLRVQKDAPGTITNIATVESPADSNPSNNSATVTTHLGRARKRMACWVFGAACNRD